MSKRWLDKFKRIFCAVFRHSNLETCCFGYISCARCREQLGDTLAGAYHNNLTVGITCDCEPCRENWKKTTWVDRFLAPDPEWIGYPEVGSYNAENKRKLQAAVERMSSVRAGTAQE